MERSSDVVTVEEPLQIRLIHGPAGERVETNVAVTMRTPGDDRALALGFLLSEGVIDDPAMVESVEAGENIVAVSVSPQATFEPEMLERHTYTASSCGICGKASIEAVRVPIPDRAGKDGFTVSADVLGRLPAALREHQAAFRQTGGIHASATFDAAGDIERVAEDVGRHNALDKLIGSYLADGSLPLLAYGLLFSGRASFELVQKAAVAGCPFVAAIGPPSSLAVELAAEQRVTLVGFLREDRFNVYTLPHRVRTSG
ncbi:MAG: formate dehydrogenase accessory sulfurtransferase FdhD [Candidatus Limnocylindrales bacterium]